MFLPVFVHPGKRGPSPVKKSPEKSTAKGGPPAPPSTTSSALSPGCSPSPLILPPCTPATAPTTPGQSNACLSLHSLVARKKISTSSRPPALVPSSVHPPARPLFFPHTCVKASRPHTHVCTHAPHTYTCTHTHGRHVHPAPARTEETYANARAV